VQGRIKEAAGPVTGDGEPKHEGRVERAEAKVMVASTS
jgi:uncharacterized protein YjbJ (UPF0337 family)